MAANMKAVKLRIKSIENTMQITKAMELVAASKLRRAKERAEKSKPYYSVLYEALAGIAAGNTDYSSPYTKKQASDAWCYVVIAGDRGFAGGYNNNLFKCLEREASGRNISVLPIGKKSVEYCRRRGIPIITEAFAEAGSISVADCFEISHLLCRDFLAGKFGHIALCYTEFVTMLSQTPKLDHVLPLTDLSLPEGKSAADYGQILYEPGSSEVFDVIVPEYLAGLIYGAMSESVASEQASRRMVMDAATKNAGEMIEELNLYYNRVRQAGITQEITEIVAGAEGG